MDASCTSATRVLKLAAILAAVLWGAFTYPVAAAAQEMCEATDHGMRADGSDNSAAFKKLLTECAGRRIHIAHGTYLFSPQGLAGGFVVPNSTALTGDGSQGEQQTVLRITASGNFNAFLWVRNVSNVAIGAIRFEGTSYESGCARHLDYGHAIYVQSDTGQSASVESVHIANNVFHNFNGQSWVTVNAAEGSPGVGLNSVISIANNVFDSDVALAGSCAGSGGIGYPVVMIWLHGSDQSPQGVVANVNVSSNTFNAGYTKGAIATWCGTHGISIEHNVINDAGLHLPPASGELGRYAVTIYNASHKATGLPPDTVRVTSNTISNPVSCGIYVAGGRNLEITGNRISGQSDRHDVTLPKGAIALNHAENVTALQDNELTGNYIGISAVGGSIKMGANRIKAAPGGTAQKIVP
jgi:hypothetical protein